MPDAVLNTMLKTQGSGTPKPFAYITGGIDLSEFKQKKNRPPPPVMPKSYRGPDLNIPEPSSTPSQPSPPVRSQQYRPQQQYQQPSPAAQHYSNNQSGYQQQQRSPGVYRHAQYNSPIQMYSHSNAEDALRTQSGGALTGISGYPEKPQQDIQQSEVYKMVQEADGKGRKPRQPRDPLLRHNSIDDEMRFSGLNKKTEIPSKTFMKLNQLSVNDTQDSSNILQSQRENNQEENEQVGNYEQTSIRYTGNHIPSPSFRVLQRFADEAQAYDTPVTKKGPPQTRQQPPESDELEDTDDGLPDTLSGEELTDKRYTGSAIPSRSFRMLQMSVGNGDTRETASPLKSSSPPPPPQQQGYAQPKITIITRSHAVPAQPLQPPEDVPSTDF